MTEIAISDKLHIFLPGKADNCAPNRFFISRHDAFLVMCSQCGGVVNRVHHVILGDSMLPMMSTCICKENRNDR